MMLRSSALIAARIVFFSSIALGPSLAEAVGITSCDKLESSLRLKAGVLLEKYRDQNKNSADDRSILFLIPGKSPEITEVKLPKGLEAPRSHIAKETLDSIKEASGGGANVIIWNTLGRPVDLLPYGNSREMSSNFNPRKDCSPTSQTLRTLHENCSVVDLSQFDSGATALYEDSAKKCDLITNFSRRTDLSKKEEAEYEHAKKSLASAFQTKTGEKRDLAIDKESTIVLPKKDPALEIGDSKPGDRSKVPAEVDDAL